mgnify:CR=1 FL=1
MQKKDAKSCVFIPALVRAEHLVFMRVLNTKNTLLYDLHKRFFEFLFITFSYLICRNFSKQNIFLNIFLFFSIFLHLSILITNKKEKRFCASLSVNQSA